MPNKMKRLARALVAVALASGFVAALVARQADPAEVQLKAAMKMETVDGDLRGAIARYQELAKNANKAVAAKALARLGGCYEKLGSAETERARQAYEQIVAKFADQAEAATQARARLTALARPTQTEVGRTHFRLSFDFSGTNGYDISRDGRYFAHTIRNRQALRITDLVTGAEHDVELASEPPGGAFSGSFMFSPDGRQIAYTWWPGVPGSIGEIRVVGTSGGSGRVIAEHTMVVRGAQDHGALQGWSSDGKEVYNYSWPGTDDLGLRSAISVSDGTDRLLPDWHFDILTVTSRMRQSPDGRHVAYTRYMNYSGKDMLAGRPAPATTLVAVADLETGKEVRVTAGDATDRDPMWSSDGSRLVFMRDHGTESALWTVAVKNGQPTGTPVYVKSFPSKITPVGMSADAAFYYLRPEDLRRRYLIGVEAGHRVASESTLTELTLGCGYAYGWAPGGRSIAIAASSAGVQDPCVSGVGDVLRIRSLGDNAERVVTPNLQSVRRPRWSPDGKSIMVTGHQDKTWGIYLVDAASGATKLLVTLSQWTDGELKVPAADWSPDGKGVFIGRQVGTPQAGYQLQLVYRDLASGQETVRYSLTQGTRGYFRPSQTSVAPDGSVWLLAHLRNEDNSVSRAVVVVPAGGGEARVVYTAKEPNTFSTAQVVSTAHVSGDGKGVWVSQGKATRENPDARELLWVPVDGGQPVSSGLTMAGLDGIVASPDGSKLLLYRNGTAMQLWTLENFLPKGATGK